MILKRFQWFHVILLHDVIASDAKCINQWDNKYENDVTLPSNFLRTFLTCFWHCSQCMNTFSTTVCKPKRTGWDKATCRYSTHVCVCISLHISCLGISTCIWLWMRMQFECIYVAYDTETSLLVGNWKESAFVIVVNEKKAESFLYGWGRQRDTETERRNGEAAEEGSYSKTREGKTTSE